MERTFPTMAGMAAPAENARPSCRTAGIFRQNRQTGHSRIPCPAFATPCSFPGFVHPARAARASHIAY
ncbi:hypothetical protein Defa_04150 [Desulfovibrio sp. TH_2024_36128]|uniref:Uncharacterized protein n=1 Tax=Desulfovibrio falkowii TaxID=3136602 RepID=A0ABQ0E5L2_9BACT